MPITIETGAGLSNADSYASVADCTSYAADMGLAFAGTTSAQEAALRKATLYLDTMYRFGGVKRSRNQALQWPRVGAMLDGYELTPDSIPAKVVKACCELAIRAMSADLVTDVSPAVVTEETVGPITTKYGPHRNGGQSRYAVVDALLSGLAGSTSTVRVERA